MNATLTRAGKALAVALFSALALTGCIKVDFELVLQPDDTVDGSITYAIAEGSGALMSDDETEYSDEELLTSLFGDIDASEYSNGVITDYTEDDWVGKTISFEGEALEGFSLDEDTEGVTITRDGDEFVVSGPYSTSDEDMTEGMDGAEMTMSITFPGEITETNGTLSEDKHTVTWDLLDPPESLEARGGATEGGSFPWLIVILVLVGVAVVGGVVGALVVMSKRKGSSTEGDAAVMAAPAPAPVVDAVAPVVPTETAAEEASAEDTVVEEAPAEETPAEETSTIEPAEDDAPAEDASTNTEAPAQDDAAVAEETAVEEPVAEEPATEESVEDEPAADADEPEADEGDEPEADEDDAPEADEDDSTKA